MLNSLQVLLPETIGIIGGGQLGRMLIYCTRKLGFRFAVLDPDPLAPARPMADTFVQGSLYDPAALKQLVAYSDVVTYEIEHLDTGTLLEAEKAGKQIYPSPSLLQIIQDKGLQKETFARAGVPVPPYFFFDGEAEAKRGTPINLSLAKRAKELGFSYPLVQKSRRGGYDGRGVRVLKSPTDELLASPSILEEYIPFQKELAVMVARDREGKVLSYPVVEMVFNPDHNICDSVLAPARISEEVAA
ncbi:MAG: ATP-grasp domain-containing protein, partial [Spirochaetales bacterium]